MSRVPKYQGPGVFVDFLKTFFESVRADEWVGQYASLGLYRRFTQTLRTIITINFHKAVPQPIFQRIDWGELTITLGYHVHNKDEHTALAFVESAECRQLFESWDWDDFLRYYNFPLIQEQLFHDALIRSTLNLKVYPGIYDSLFVEAVTADVNAVLTKHEKSFRKYQCALNLNTLESIGLEIFQDSFSWGHVVTYLAFVAYAINAVTDEVPANGAVPFELKVNEAVTNFAHVSFLVCNGASLRHTGRELNWEDSHYNLDKKPGGGGCVGVGSVFGVVHRFFKWTRNKLFNVK